MSKTETELFREIRHELGNLMMLPYYHRSERDNYNEVITQSDYEKMGEKLLEFLPKYEALMNKVSLEVNKSYVGSY